MDRIKKQITQTINLLIIVDKSYEPIDNLKRSVSMRINSNSYIYNLNTANVYISLFVLTFPGRGALCVEGKTTDGCRRHVFSKRALTWIIYRQYTKSISEYEHGYLNRYMLKKKKRTFIQMKSKKKSCDIEFIRINFRHRKTRCNT